MDMEAATMNINVKYSLIDGAHFYTSGDEQSYGLCVAHNDPRKAFDEVATQLAYLFKANHGMDAVVTPSGPIPETEGNFIWGVKCQKPMTGG